MIVIADNGTLNAIDLMVDAAGVDVLIDRLTQLKNSSMKHHLHLEDPHVGMISPAGHRKIFGGLVLVWIDEDALGQNN
ncbi:hypothetical protein [Bradyrhizobium sp. CB3481]|uniref:hypothetical protein n=1 Tax=Bradyrhizobium sp. CB3481 TaxID=3039158 RepID=UPI0024B1BD4C|nr:hypothetical protein [Bradyrhizobium sp. CB3481]WFU16613.1 hypothetical protein QA643_37740 [Bradyrhizobium sp. CB3481]